MKALHEQELLDIAQMCGQEPIASYVLLLQAHLRNRLPREYCDRACHETAFWLRSAAQDLMQEGHSENSAAELAVARHEPPRSLADAIVLDCYESDLDSALANKFGRANVLASAVLWTANLVYLIFLQVTTFLPGDRALRLPFTLAQWRQIFPATIAYPDASPAYLFQIAYPVVAPVLLGVLCARLIPSRAPEVIFRTMIPLAVATTLFGWGMLPRTDGLVYALVQIAYWIPGMYLIASACSKGGAVRRREAAR